MAKRTRLFVAAVPVLLPFLLQGQQEPPSPSGGPPSAMHHPMPSPVNLKVLPKDIAPEELLRIMHGFTAQLGVHCDFCHAQDPATGHLNFASDEKPTKDITRTMMLMTRDINTNFLSKVDVPDAKPDERKVTCGTCHRGVSIPEVFHPAEQSGPPPHS